MRANDEFIGLVGLMERQATKIRKVPGVKLRGEPQRIEYPSPDGYFVELNKILGTPAGRMP